MVFSSSQNYEYALAKGAKYFTLGLLCKRRSGSRKAI